MKRQPRVYVAGPYNGGGDKDIIKAVNWGDFLAVIGYVPFIPHLNHLWHLMNPHDSSFWRAWDMEWLYVCDAVYRLKGESDGADAEVAVAKEREIPVFTELLDLEIWRRDVWSKL